MGLKDELGLKGEFYSAGHEAALSIYHTTSVLRKCADIFFSQYGLTDVQFNVLVLVQFQGGGTGLSQVELSRMMLVNRANITSLIDRMEAAGLVRREPDPADRRYKVIRLTPKGEGMVEEVYEPYHAHIKRIMGALGNEETAALIRALEVIRQRAGSL